MIRWLWLAAAIAIAGLWAGPTRAQSACANIYYADPSKPLVLTPGQWNQCFSNKQDVLNYTPLNIGGGVLTGPLTLPPSSASGAGLNLGIGVAPTAPNNGDLWTTNFGLYVQANGQTIGPLVGGTFTPNLPVIGSASSGLAQGTRSGNTSNYATVAGTPLATHCAQFDANLNLVDAGGTCTTGGGGGTVSGGLANQVAFYAAAGNVVGGVGPANNAVLITSAAGVPSLSATLPAAVQANITMLAAGVAAGNLGSGSSNQFAATPNGSSGVVSVRSMVANDMPAVLNSGTQFGTGAGQTSVIVNGTSTNALFIARWTGADEAYFGANGTYNVFAYDVPQSTYAFGCSSGQCYFGESGKNTILQGGNGYLPTYVSMGNGATPSNLIMNGSNSVSIYTQFNGTNEAQFGSNSSFNVYLYDDLNGQYVFGCQSGTCQIGEPSHNVNVAGNLQVGVAGNAILAVGGALVQDGSNNAFYRSQAAGSSTYLGAATQNYLQIGSAGLISQLNGALFANDPTGNVTYVTPGFCPISSLTGTTDNTACIRSAVAAQCAKTGGGGGMVVLGPYPYYIAANQAGSYSGGGGINIPKLCAGLRIVGTGGIGADLHNGNGGAPYAGTRIYTSSACTGPPIFFYSDATQNYIYGGGVEDIAFINDEGGTSCTSYPLIRMQFAEHAAFNNLYAWLPYQFMILQSGFHIKITHVLLDQVYQDSPGAFELYGTGATANGTGQLTRQDAVSMQNVFMGGGPLSSGHHPFTGIRWHMFTATLSLRTVATENVGSFLYSDCAGGGATDSSACPAFIDAYDIQAEGSDGLGNNDLIYMVDTFGVHIHDIYMDCLSSMSGIATACNNVIGITNSIFHTSEDFQIFGGQINGSAASCVWSEVKGLVIIGARIMGCGLTVGGSAGVDLVGPNTGDVFGSNRIIGNNFCAAGSSGAGSNFSAAVNIHTGNDYNVVNDNTFQGCNAGVANGGGTHYSISGNAGP